MAPAASQDILVQTVRSAWCCVSADMMDSLISGVSERTAARVEGCGDLSNK